MVEPFDAKLSVSSLRAPARLPWATENRGDGGFWRARTGNADLMLIGTQFPVALPPSAWPSHLMVPQEPETSVVSRSTPVCSSNRWRGTALGQYAQEVGVWRKPRWLLHDGSAHPGRPPLTLTKRSKKIFSRMTPHNKRSDFSA